MKEWIEVFRSGPPIVRAGMAHLGALVVLWLAAHGLELLLNQAWDWGFQGLTSEGIKFLAGIPDWGFYVLEGGLALLGGRWLRLAWWWGPINLGLALAVYLQLQKPVLSPVYFLVAFGVLALIYGGGVLTQVPLYNSHRSAWEALEACLPKEAGIRFIDLGAGLGGPLVYLAKARPDAWIEGVEASPLTFLLAWLRRWPWRRNCRMRWGSLWKVDLAAFDVVYAFLSPVPMAALWEKACAEMRPGTIFLSNTFLIPGTPPCQSWKLEGRLDAYLYLWRIPQPSEKNDTISRNG